ncbi:unnamed protein product [Linum trigynum]|uniref:Uncharacterized protein n=1 Tax=Linum trigynum TaxID=586398 RepID=A0AAV2F2A6_9ROSI
MSLKCKKKKIEYAIRVLRPFAAAINIIFIPSFLHLIKTKLRANSPRSGVGTFANSSRSAPTRPADYSSSTSSAEQGRRSIVRSKDLVYWGCGGKFRSSFGIWSSLTTTGSDHWSGGGSHRRRKAMANETLQRQDRGLR